ncbi:MAG: DUF2147 domain-containing protein [Hyphomicrobium sp.]
MGLQTSRRILSASGIAAAAIGLISATSASAASDPRGVWLTDSGRGAIEIKNCGSGLCGYVVWVKAGSDAYGCGKQIIGEVQDSGGAWDGGWIYNPDKKKRYDVELEPMSNGNLRVTGFAGIRFLSKTMIWKPAPADLERCDAEEAARPAPIEKPKAASVAPAPVKSARVEAEALEADTPAVAAEPKKAKPAPVEVTEDEAADDDTSTSTNVNLDDGIEVGDVFSMKKTGEGKCRIKAPFVNITVDCDRKGKDDNDD